MVYANKSPLDLLGTAEVFKDGSLDFKDNFKSLPWDSEVDTLEGKIDSRKDIMVQNYYKGTAVKWCFPFRTNINNHDLGVDKNSPSGNATITYVRHDTLNEYAVNEFDMYDSEDSIDMRHSISMTSTLLVGDNFFYLTDTNIVSRINGGISDCIVFNHFHEPDLVPTDILLVIQRDGTLLAILPQRYGYPLPQFLKYDLDSRYLSSITHNKETSRASNSNEKFIKIDRPLILQHFKLKPNENWKLHKSSKNNGHFIVTDFESGIIKFFKFTSQCHFKFIETIRFDCKKIISCYFLPEKYNKVFISLIVANRMTHFYIEWDDNTSKKIYKVNHPNCESMKCSIPVGPDNILLCSNKKIVLLSTRQIVSGDTNYIYYENNILRGIKSWFDDPTLTTKLINVINSKSLLPHSLNDNDKCTIVLTTTSVLYAIFVTEDDKKLYLFSLGRFKELRDIYSDIKQDDTHEFSHMFIASILNRTVRLELNLNNIKHVSFSSKQLPKRKPVENKTTISSNSDANNFKIAHVTNKNEIWLAGNSSISQLSDNSIIPLRKSKKVGKFYHSFRNYESINTSEKMYCYSGTNKQYLQGIQADGSIDGFRFNYERQDFKKEEEKSSKEPILFWEEYSTHDLKITKKQVLSVTSNSQKVILSSGSEIDGVCCLLEKLIIWSEPTKKVWLLTNINSINTIHCTECDYFAEALKNEQHFSFNICHSFDIMTECSPVIILNTSEKYFVSDWDTIVSSGNNLTSLDGVFKPWNKFAMLPNGFFCYTGFKDPAKIMCGTDIEVDAVISSLYVLEESNGRTDFTIKSLNNKKNIAIIYWDKLYLISCETADLSVSTKDYGFDDNYAYNSVVHLEEIKLPQLDSRKPSYLIDVESINNDGKGLLCLLYDNGMQCIEPTYLTWNKTDYLLHNTKSKNKIFTHLKNINRMLVTNCDSNDWHLMNLNNGKIKLLDDQYLKEPMERIQNVIEMPSTDVHSDKCSTLVIIFNTTIIHIVLSVHNSDVQVKFIKKYEFDGNLHKEYGLCGNSFTLLEIQSDDEIFHRFNVDETDGSIHFNNKFSIKSKSPTTHFVAGPDFMLLSGKFKTTQLIVMLNNPDLLSGPLTHQDLLKSVTSQGYSFPPVRKIYHLTSHVVAIVFDKGQYLNQTSQIVIIPISTSFENGSYFGPGDRDSYDDNRVVCFWQFLNNHMGMFHAHKHNRLIYSNFEYINDPYELFGQSVTEAKRIDLDKTVLDLTYTNGVLNVLLHDQSVVQFGIDTVNFDAKRGALNRNTDGLTKEKIKKNYGYVVPSNDPYLGSMNSQDIDPNLSFIDPWGRRILHDL
ncbi:hypothetical protein MOSE0_F01068 [Monosporozyma servazzii]